MRLEVINIDAENRGYVELDEDLFGLPVRVDVLHRVVEWQRSKRQAGTHKTKTISEIRGTTMKPFRQKGTGRARQGSRRASQMVGGQTVFGPVVRSHAHKLTKKFRSLGLKTALSAKQADGLIVVVEGLSVESVSTKRLADRFARFGWSNPLIVDVSFDGAFEKSVRNIKKVDVIPVGGVNVMDILNHRELVLTKDALIALGERLK